MYGTQPSTTPHSSEEPGQRPLCVQVWKGWTNIRTFDGNASFAVSSVVSPSFQRIHGLEDRWLQGALYFSAFSAIRKLRLQLKPYLIATVFITTTLGLAAVFGLGLLDAFRDDNGQYSVLSILLAMYAILIPVDLIYERYIVFPRQHAALQDAVRSMAPGFAAKGWHLEYVVEHEQSPTGVAAFYQLTPIQGQAEKENVPDFFPPAKSAPLPSEEIWITFYRNRYTQVFCRPCTHSHPTYMDGIPESMQSSIDWFLWGALGTALRQAKYGYHQRKMCCDCGLSLVASFLSMFLLIALLVAIVIQGIELSAVARQFVILGYFVLYIWILIMFTSCSDVRMSREGLHPAGRQVVEEFAPHFETVGYYLEYVTDEQSVPFSNGCLPRAGEAYLRFVPTTQAYVKIPDDMATGMMV